MDYWGSTLNCSFAHLNLLVGRYVHWYIFLSEEPMRHMRPMTHFRPINQANPVLCHIIELAIQKIILKGWYYYLFHFVMANFSIQTSDRKLNTCDPRGLCKASGKLFNDFNYPFKLSDQSSLIPLWCIVITLIMMNTVGINMDVLYTLLIIEQENPISRLPHQRSLPTITI